MLRPAWRRLLFALALSLAGAPAVAQKDPLAEAWRWVHFTTDSGLPADQVFDLVEASDGTPWVLTREGVAWYDGFDWQPVVHGGGTPFGGGTRFHPDLEGGVLIASGHHVFQVSRDAFRLLETTLDGEPLAVLEAVPLDRERLLLLTSGAIHVLGPGGLSGFSAPEGLTSWARLARTRRGTVWLSLARGTFTWSGERWSRWSDFPCAELFEQRGGGELAVGNPSANQGLWSKTPGGSLERVGPDDLGLVAAIAMAPDGDTVLTYESSRVRVRRDGRWSWLATPPYELEHPVFLRFQRNGDLWVGAEDRLLLHRGSNARWTRWRPYGKEVHTTQTNALFLTSQGELWVATGSGLFVRRADGRSEHLPGPPEQPLRVVTGLARDGSGAIWVSSGAASEGFPGAYRWQAGEWTHFGAADGLPAPRVHRIVPDRRGRLWFLGVSDRPGHDEPGAFLREGDAFVPWGPAKGLPSGRVYGFAEGPAGELWFATLGGLSRWDEGRWTHWGKADGLRHRRVFTLAVGEEGDVWFGHKMSSLGLGYLDADGTPRYLTTVDGLVHDQVNELCFGPDGALWIGTHAGLSRHHEGVLSSFDRRSGLLHPHVWPVLPTDGRVYVGTMGGGVYELDLAESTNPPPRVRVLDPVVDEHGSLFRWRATAYRGALAAEVVPTRTRMDAGPWSSWSTARELHTIGLSPGQHVFEVQAKGLFGSPGTPAAARIEIPPPFYRRPFFLGLIAVWLVSLSLLGALLWRRKRKHRLLLRAREARYRTLVDELPIGIHELDLAGRVQTVNPAGLRSLASGHAPADVVGTPYTELVVSEDRERVGERVRAAADGRPSQFEFTAVVGAERRRVSSTIVPLRDEHGAVVKLLGTTQDITDRERAEGERRQLERQLLQAQKMEAIGLLAGSVAHDFNNLLTVVGGYATLLEQNEELPESGIEPVREIQRAHDRAAALTRQLLAFGRPQPTRPRHVSVNALVEGMADMLGRLIGEEVELAVELCSDAESVRADPGQIERILANLVVNARDAMPHGGLLSIRTHVLATDAGDAAAPGWVVLSVGDTGVGMSAETQARMFEPFFTTKSKGKGTGLGLSTVFGIVQQSGGHIEVTSEVARGTRFAVHLPRVREPAVADDPLESRDTWGAWTGSGTVLVVDDDASLLSLVADVLARHGYDVLRATGGREALRIAREHDGAVQLLLTDVLMPGMNGRELSEAFLRSWPDTPVLYMSGYADATKLSPGGWEPDDPLLKKPFQLESLLRRVRELMRHRTTGSLSPP